MTDEGLPNPPGKLTYAIESLPLHGTLEYQDGLAIAKPTVLAQHTSQVVYRPAADFTGDDSPTFSADDGGSPPFGGVPDTATVILSVVDLVTHQDQVGAGEDDTTGTSGYQVTTGRYLWLGQYSSAMRFQEIVDRPDWTIDNPLMILYSGDGKPDGDLLFSACAGPHSNRAARPEVTYGLLTPTILPPTVNQTPPAAHDQVTETAFNATLRVTLSATDDGLPDPPGGLTHAIASLPHHGSLERPGGGWLTQPGILPGSGNQVTCHPLELAYAP